MIISGFSRGQLKSGRLKVVAQRIKYSSMCLSQGVL